MNTNNSTSNEYESFNVLGRIDELLRERGWSKNELAKRSHMTQSTISSWYSRNYVPGIPSIDRVCRAFGITLTEFFITEKDFTFTLTQRQKELLLASSKLSDEQYEMLLKFIKTL
ncbi:MAG: helix-turn-helix transcriptional regulator [Eubacterium sp.]|nr:helix-turn-helix transcriptional regulator [Eubacterium sp.]